MRKRIVVSVAFWVIVALASAYAQTKEVVNKKWEDHIDSILTNIWEREAKPYGYSYDEFRKEIWNRSDHFNPRYMANILFSAPKAREQYLRDYYVALKLKGLNLEEAISYPQRGPGRFAQSLKETLKNPKALEQKKSWDDLHYVFESIVVESGKPIDPQVLAKIDQQIENIGTQKNMLPAAKAIFYLLQSAYGVNLSYLIDMGAAPWLEKYVPGGDTK